MCDNPIMCYLASKPKPFFGNFFISTRQYREIVQLTKEYLFFPSKSNEKYLKRFDEVHTVYVPCGKCIQCVNSRSKQWEIRSALTAKSYKDCCCLTLTYDDDHLPKMADFISTDDGLVRVPNDKKGIINYKDVQDFIKRLRKYYNFKREIRYFACSEYGGNGTLRPHYHIILFNFTPPDIDPRSARRSNKGTILYKSPLLTRLWSNGFVDVGKVTLQTCRYISQYCCKNLLKERKSDNAQNKFLLKLKNKISRERIYASIGLGLDYLKRNYLSIFNAGKICYGKFVYPIPRYFLKKLETLCPSLYQNVKKKAHDYWLNFKWTQEDQKQAHIKSELLLRRMNLFHSPMFNLLSS